MSLTGFLRYRDVSERFSQEFPITRVSLAGKLLAPPRSKRWSLVGTAFDYLLRFYLKRINPGAVETEWVAEGAIKAPGISESACELGKDEHGRWRAKVFEQIPLPGRKTTYYKIERILSKSRTHYE